jgi:hypothetical protein
MADITGDDFGNIFASSIGGTHRGSPLGIADVAWENCAWSVKTVCSSKPFTQTIVRLISGRNSPGFSHGITDPLNDIQVTGSAILEIWNARVNEAYAEYDDLRIFILLRNISKLEFLVMEHEAIRYQPRDYVWTLNTRGNLVGNHRDSGEHHFTWQPHGSQFTILHHIPASAQRFRILRHPAVHGEERILDAMGFDESWIETIVASPASISIEASDADAEPIEEA